ncbi:alanyl-tRNA editing protein [Bengtsoniella intestinalis]|uniref:alanyl-tRNA editing protein n=1 Tax=Bengtsoniella intestinalis TaxID=3073143 RepID=UPI00391FA16A
MTTKLYYQDPMLQTFTATVVDCQALKKGFAITLDQTAFYPEGGGQNADFGTLNTVHVTDVQAHDDVIVHTCDAPLTVGDTVTGQLDWARRFDHMQHHSGEHIISGILCDLYHCDNVGFHMGADTVTIDYNAEISWEQALIAEAKANQIIWGNAPVKITFPDADALEALDYRSKKAVTGAVRIVTFPHADCCACCGTHVVQAGQVGLIKVLSCQKFKGGSRIELVCGGKAMAYFEAILTQNRQISQQLSAKPLETANAVAKLGDTLTQRIGQVMALEANLFAHIAQTYTDAGDILLFQEAMSADSVRRLCLAIGEVCGGQCAVFAGEGDRYGYAISKVDPAFVKEMNASLQGRGGGRDGFAQGSVSATQEQIAQFFHRP